MKHFCGIIEAFVKHLSRRIKAPLEHNYRVLKAFEKKPKKQVIQLCYYINNFHTFLDQISST
jgi:hypothetical protein